VLHERFAFAECEPATELDLLRCHTPELVEQVKTARGFLDGDTLCTETTYEAALLAAGAAIEAARTGGFALARPPGHHAERHRAMGFCLFDSIAIAARYAQAELGIERVAIVDWDVHHGNGTQDIVGDDPSIFSECGMKRLKSGCLNRRTSSSNQCLSSHSPPPSASGSCPPSRCRSSRYSWSGRRRP